jgi:drug/metabolite transporter (DMT)-like permease
LTIIEPIIKSNHGFIGLEGNLLVFASIMIGPIVAVLAKKVLRRGVDPKTTTSMSFIIGFVSLAPFTLPSIINSKFQVITAVPFSFHLGVLYMAILSGTLAYILWNKAVKSIEIGEVSVFTYLYPIFGTPLSILWLGEKITPIYIVGVLISACGVFIAEFKKRRK